MNDSILTKLEDAILKGSYPPGSKLLERDLADKFGVSRVPVREALQTLERWGLVNRLNKGGRIRVVAARKKETILNAYNLRAMLEAQALSWQAQLGNLVLLHTLQSLVEQMHELIQKSDLATYRKTNAVFHFEIIKAVNNQKLNEAYLDVNRMIRWYQSRTLYEMRMESSNQDHREMVAAYQEKDLTKINLLFMKHHNHALELIIEGIEAGEENDELDNRRMEKELLRII